MDNPPLFNRFANFLSQFRLFFYNISDDKKSSLAIFSKELDAALFTDNGNNVGYNFNFKNSIYFLKNCLIDFLN